MPGPSIAALQIGDPPQRWAVLGFTVDERGCCRLGATELHLGAAGTGIVGWTLTGEPGGDVDGLPTSYGASPLGAPPAHANTAVGVDHVVLTTDDVDRTFAALARAGMTLRREREAGTPERPLRQGFFRHGEAILEVVGPAEAHGDAPARLWGVTLEVADLDACAELLGERLGRVSDAVQPGRRIATVRPAAGLTVPLALMST